MGTTFARRFEEQDIILSYRLLFGQDDKSRKVAHEEICMLKNSHAKQNVDDMLSHLCERKYKYGSLWWTTYDKTCRVIRPRRNPLQWYTFWAVLLVGGLANILAVLQLLVAIVALKI
ncbi:hypothetical protein N7447_009369 [Penicillium robsamsonii]|uniref:uncharacterized protein n=1 Tax=Penicillium robsamsonii TaxID=1792511 RepID=UPI002547749E|nr:uncharacterized protein N7447_009369 [Penicillium robsamsonii]KAJ5817136.1 hypothetical protein N7447_009369 [Penicillium robsamsonii]